MNLLFLTMFSNRPLKLASLTLAGAAVIALAFLVRPYWTDETISGYAPYERYVLTELDGQAFVGDVTIEFSEEGRVSGQGPCNRYFAEQLAPLPWFELGPIGATKMACPHLNLETKFFSALSRARFAESLGEVLTLSDENGVILTFKAAN